MVADKGYHSNRTMTEIEDRWLRSYVSEPNRGRRNWKRNRDAQEPTYANRRRIRGDRGEAAVAPEGREAGSGDSRTSSQPVGCAASTFAGTTRFENGS